MPIKLIVTQESDLEGRREFGYDEEVVTIGRDQANTLYLPDSERKLVSRKHAKIERQGDNFYLVDLESRNATFLNGDRLDTKQAYALKDGDTIKIGDYVISFVVPPPARVKLAAPSQAEAPATAQQDSIRRDLEEKLQQVQTEIHRLREENQHLQVSTRSQGVFPAGAAATRLQQALEVLLEAAVKVVQAPTIFSSEFEGVSVLFPKEYSSVQALKEHLFNPTLSGPEVNKRLAQLQEALERDIMHQGIGLLEGYKTSVQEGTRQLLQNLAPATIKQKTAEKKIRLGPLQIPYRYLPVFWQWKSIQLYRQKHEELMQETRGVLEKRIFRPAFFKGYHTFMDSLWREKADKK